MNDHNMMMTDDSHHAIGYILAEDSNDNMIDFAGDNDINIINEDLLRDSTFSKFSVDSKFSTELAHMFDEEEAPHANDMQMQFDYDDTANSNMMMMEHIETKIIVPSKYDDVVLPEPDPIGAVVQHQQRQVAVAAAVHQESAPQAWIKYSYPRPQEPPSIKPQKTPVLYPVVRSTKSRRRRASQPEPYRPQVVHEVKPSKQAFDYPPPYNHEEYQNQVKKSEEYEEVAKKRRSCNGIELLMDVNSQSERKGAGQVPLPLGEIAPPPQKHQRGINGYRLQRRATVDSCSSPPSLNDLFGHGSSITSITTTHSSNQLNRLAESMKRTAMSRRQLAYYPTPQEVMGSSDATAGRPSPPPGSSTSSDSLNALFGEVEETAIPTRLECSSPTVNNNSSSNINLAAFFSGSRGTLTNGLEQSRRQMRMYAGELKRTM